MNVKAHTMTHWWQPCDSTKNNIMATTSTPNGEVSAPYPSDLTNYNDCYGMSSPSFTNEFHHDAHFIDNVATPPTSASQSQNVAFASNLSLSYPHNYIPAMPQSPQSVYSDNSHQYLDQHTMASPPYLSPQQQFYQHTPPQRVASLNGHLGRSSHGTRAPHGDRHSWPTFPTSDFTVPVPPNVDNPHLVPMDIEPSFNPVPYGSPAFHHLSPSSPEASQSSHSSYQHPQSDMMAPIPPTHRLVGQESQPERMTAIPPALRPGGRDPESLRQTEPPSSQVQGAKHACPIATCHCTYKRKFELDRHLQEKHGPNSGRLLCPGDMCPRGIRGEGFDRMAHLVNHLISGKHNWTKEQAVYAARKFNPKKGGAGVRVSEARMEMMA